MDESTPPSTAALPLPPARPSLTPQIVTLMLEHGQGGRAPLVVGRCRDWLGQPPAGGDLIGDFWLHLIMFYSGEADDVQVDRISVADRMIDVAARARNPIATSLGHSCRAVTLGSGSHSVMSFPDLSAATVLLEENLPAVTPITDLGTDLRAFLLVVACNGLALALMRLGLHDHALTWLSRTRELAGSDPAGRSRVFIATFNEGWTHLTEGFDADLDGDATGAADLYRRASESFLRASDVLPANESPLAPSAVRFGLAAAALAGDLGAGERLRGQLISGDYRRPDHRAVCLLAVAHAEILQGRFDEALARLPAALDTVLPDHSFRSISSRIMLERVIAARGGLPATRSEQAQAELLALILGERRRERDAHRAVYDEALAGQRRRREMEHARDAALRDDLTGLGNRRMLETQVAGLLDETRSAGTDLCMVFIDLDHFKEVNDRRSHLAGDTVLRKLADEIRSMLSPDDLAIRYGGDEFVLILIGRTADRTVTDVDDLRQRFRSLTLGHPDVRTAVGFSAGVAQAGPDDSINDLLLAADRAMLDGKRAGRNRVVLRAIPDP